MRLRHVVWSWSLSTTAAAAVADAVAVAVAVADTDTVDLCVQDMKEYSSTWKWYNVCLESLVEGSLTFDLMEVYSFASVVPYRKYSVCVRGGRTCRGIRCLLLGR